MKAFKILAFSIFFGASLNAQVGFGTTSPSNDIDVESSSATATAVDINCTGAGDPKINFQLSGTTTFSIGIDNSDSDKLKIGTSALETNTRLTIDASGNVGIGTSSSSYKLDVDGEITSRSYNGFRMRQSNYSTFWRNDDIQTLLLITANGDPDGLWNSLRPLTINHSNGAVDIGGTAMNVQNNGNVGLGTTVPDQKLSVNGNASKTGGGAWATFSDKRLKKNINVFNDGLDKLMQINPVSFQYNGLAGYTNDSTTFVGVIAQDVEKVAPYMIEHVQKKLNENDSVTTDLLMYDGSALTYILVNAVKEQQAIIEAQKKEIEAQKVEIDALKVNALKVAELENKINAMLLLLNNKQELTVKQ